MMLKGSYPIILSKLHLRLELLNHTYLCSYKTILNMLIHTNLQYNNFYINWEV